MTLIRQNLPCSETLDLLPGRIRCRSSTTGSTTGTSRFFAASSTRFSGTTATTSTTGSRAPEMRRPPNNPPVRSPPTGMGGQSPRGLDHSEQGLQHEGRGPAGRPHDRDAGGGSEHLIRRVVRFPALGVWAVTPDCGPCVPSSAACPRIRPGPWPPRRNRRAGSSPPTRRPDWCWAPRCRDRAGDHGLGLGADLIQ